MATDYGQIAEEYKRSNDYASTYDELLEMCRSVTRHLRPGCRFATFNTNPATVSQETDYRSYGFERLVPEVVHEESPYVCRNHQDGTNFDITIYHLDRNTHDRTFAEADLVDVRWIPPSVSSEGVELYGEEYWKVFLEVPPVIQVECETSGNCKT